MTAVISYPEFRESLHDLVDVSGERCERKLGADCPAMKTMRAAVDRAVAVLEQAETPTKVLDDAARGGAPEAGLLSFEAVSDLISRIVVDSIRSSLKPWDPERRKRNPCQASIVLQEQVRGLLQRYERDHANVVLAKATAAAIIRKNDSADRAVVAAHLAESPPSPADYDGDVTDLLGRDRDS